MVWYCEDCEEEVAVLVEVTDISFGKDSSPNEINRWLRYECIPFFRCEECDGTRVVWKLG
jgi:hypothetical protein